MAQLKGRRHHAPPRKEGRPPRVDLKRHDLTALDVGGSPTEPPLASSPRPGERTYERRWDET